MEKSQNLLNTFLQKSAGYHNLMPAALTFQAEIRSGTQHLPLFASAGMLLFQSHHVSNIDVHLSILQQYNTRSANLYHKSFSLPPAKPAPREHFNPRFGPHLQEVRTFSPHKFPTRKSFTTPRNSLSRLLGPIPSTELAASPSTLAYPCFLAMPSARNT